MQLCFSAHNIYRGFQVLTAMMVFLVLTDAMDTQVGMENPDLTENQVSV